MRSKPSSGAPPIRVALLACVRNVAPTISAFLADVDALDAALGSLSVIVFENDSTDGTASLLRAWMRRTRVSSTLLTGEVAGARTDRLAVCRNALWAEALKRKPDVVAMIDADYRSARLDVANLLERMRGCGHTACFAASVPYIYDQWALRDAYYAHTDVFRDGLFQFLTRVPLAVPVDSTRRVRSAFNGLAVYNVTANGEAFSRCRYSGRYDGEDAYPVCEHVPFHDCLGRFGASLVIDGRLRTPHAGSLCRTVGIHYLLPALMCIVLLLAHAASPPRVPTREARRRRVDGDRAWRIDRKPMAEEIPLQASGDP